jgi:hypothetical protein
LNDIIATLMQAALAAIPAAADDVIKIGSGGNPAGLLARAPERAFARRNVAWGRGAITFISSRVAEAGNARRELFGFDRTREISTKSAAEIAEAARAWGPNDDITVVTVRRTG